MKIGRKLTALRRAAGLSQQEVASYISERLSPITNRAVSKWETDVSYPDAAQFILLCGLYGVADVSGEFIGEAMDSPFSGLNREGVMLARELIGLIRSSERYKAEEPARAAAAPREKRTIPLYDMTASQGTGIFLDSDAFVPYESESIPPSANFAVRMVGDSMSPEYRNGQVLFVRSATELETGDVGIFIVNGDACCRRLDRVDGVKLIALNPGYAPISFKYSYELRTVGKVVGAA